MKLKKYYANNKIERKRKCVGKFFQSLNAFSSDELIIIKEDQNFLDNQKYWINELEDINKGDEDFLNHEDLENALNSVFAEN